MRIIQPEYTNDATLAATNVAEADYPLWDSVTSYAINTTLIYIDTNKHWVIRSLVGSNLNNIPTGLDTDTKWVKVSETNRWKMFDLKTTSQTFNQDLIDVTINGLSFVDSVAALNLDGASVQIVAKDQYGVTFYDETYSLVSVEGIYDPYTYFFSPLIYLTDLVITDLPIYALANYEITINKTGGIAKCGTLLIGKVIDVGGTDYGMNIGITDYSIKSANEFGDFVITERAYSKNIQLTANVEKVNVNSVINMLNRFRATPIVYLGADEYTSSFAYGFYKDYGVIVQYANYSKLQIEIESLS
jgi:hypothetical protein